MLANDPMQFSAWLIAFVQIAAVFMQILSVSHRLRKRAKGNLPRGVYKNT
jgi:hypothetical protein